MGAQQSTNSQLPPCEGGKAALRNAESDPSACPIPEEYRSKPVYNVYNQRIDGATTSTPQAYVSAVGGIDPKNNMPLTPNQQPAPGQREILSVERVQSTIPKGGTDTTWLYPSPQMFYNALMRKGKGDDVTEADMDAVVHTHNSMNELTWQAVQQWERLHPETARAARLQRFLGRPHDLSPLARLRTLLGGPAPFDRHDWYVDRGAGRVVRYVIDFYFDEDRAGSPEAFEITARPALDTVEDALDRARMAIYIQCAKWGVPCPITGDAGSVVPQAAHQQEQSS